MHDILHWLILSVRIISQCITRLVIVANIIIQITRISYLLILAISKKKWSTILLPACIILLNGPRLISSTSSKPRIVLYTSVHVEKCLIANVLPEVVHSF